MTFSLSAFPTNHRDGLMRVVSYGAIACLQNIALSAKRH